MLAFPDESQMPRSQTGLEPVRGSSIGFNEVLGHFVKASQKDHRPHWTCLLVSAFTVFRNVFTMHKEPKLEDLEEPFTRDILLLLDYYNTYLSHVWNGIDRQKFCPVIIYFPDYRHVSKTVLREHTGRNALLFDLYDKFLSKHRFKDGPIQQREYCQCFWIHCGENTLPHIDLARKYREITRHKNCLYSDGDKLCLMTSLPLDYHLARRVRNLQLFKSNNAEIQDPKQFGLRLDKKGRIPFLPCTHLAFGDDIQIKPHLVRGMRVAVLDTADTEHWTMLSEDSVRNRLIRQTDMSLSMFRQYDFT